MKNIEVKTLLNNSYNVFFWITIILICGFSLYLRFLIFNNNIGFFSDEINILLNCFERNYADLFRILDYGQCMPPLFIIMIKFLYSVFGINEKLLKLPSLFLRY